MFIQRGRRRTAATAAVLAAGLIALAGCGGPSGRGNGKIIYKGPEEVDQKKADLKEAMQGGAYGSSGRKAAPKMGP